MHNFLPIKKLNNTKGLIKLSIKKLLMVLDNTSSKNHKKFQTHKIHSHKLFYV